MGSSFVVMLVLIRVVYTACMDVQLKALACTCRHGLIILQCLTAHTIMYIIVRQVYTYKFCEPMQIEVERTLKVHDHNVYSDDLVKVTGKEFH